MSGTGATGLSSVGNASRLLKEFLGPEATLGVSELARRLGLGKSTVHRMATTLVHEGLLDKDLSTGGYRLGLVVFELGEQVRVHLDLHAACGPVLSSLREHTGESAQVGILDGHQVVYVDRLESSHSLRLFTQTGRRVPLHCTSSGKVLLAHLPEAQLRRLLAELPLPALTVHTITDAGALAVELANVRRRGWAEAVNEREVGVASVAAPIRDRLGTVVAAVSVGAPTARLSAVQRRRVARLVLDSGEAASRRLGWSPEGSARQPPAAHGSSIQEV